MEKSAVEKDRKPSDKERKAPSGDSEKEREKEKSSRSRASSKASAPAPPPTTTVTMRDKTNRVHSRSSSGTTKPPSRDGSHKESHKTSKAHRAAQAADAAPVVRPSDVPLPESPKLAPSHPREPTPPVVEQLSSTVEIDFPVLQPSRPPSVRIEPASVPADVPLPASRPESEGQQTPPTTEPAQPVIVHAIDPHTPTPEHQPQRRFEVEQTPISALVASIERGFLKMHQGVPLSPMKEEDESVLVGGDSDADGRVFCVEGFQPVAVQPLFSR